MKRILGATSAGNACEQGEKQMYIGGGLILLIIIIIILVLIFR
jgi:hypothetical protein